MSRPLDSSFPDAATRRPTLMRGSLEKVSICFDRFDLSLTAKIDRLVYVDRIRCKEMRVVRKKDLRWILDRSR